MDWGEGEYNEQKGKNTREGKEELCTEDEEEKSRGVVRRGG